jgi:hypothetical protein
VRLKLIKSHNCSEFRSAEYKFHDPFSHPSSVFENFLLAVDHSSDCHLGKSTKEEVKHVAMKNADISYLQV